MNGEGTLLTIMYEIIALNCWQVVHPRCITMLDMSVCENETDELVKIIEQKNESTPSLIGQFFFLTADKLITRASLLLKTPSFFFLEPIEL